MSGWMRVVAYAFITLFLGVLLKELGFKGSKLTLLLGTVCIVGAAVLCIGEVFSSMPKIEDGEEYTVAMLKIVGVGYACGVCADICAELGETSLAGAVCLFGRVEIITLSLPFIKRIVERGIELM